MLRVVEKTARTGENGFCVDAPSLADLWPFAANKGHGALGGPVGGHRRSPRERRGVRAQFPRRNRLEARNAALFFIRDWSLFISSNNPTVINNGGAK